jgi:hypothetical protein
MGLAKQGCELVNTLLTQSAINRAQRPHPA